MANYSKAKGREFTNIYVPWELRERLRMLAKKENRKMVAVIEQMIKEREGRDSAAG